MVTNMKQRIAFALWVARNSPIKGEPLEEIVKALDDGDVASAIDVCTGQVLLSRKCEQVANILIGRGEVAQGTPAGDMEYF